MLGLLRIRFRVGQIYEKTEKHVKKEGIQNLEGGFVKCITDKQMKSCIMVEIRLTTLTGSTRYCITKLICQTKVLLLQLISMKLSGLNQVNLLELHLTHSNNEHFLELIPLFSGRKAWIHIPKTEHAACSTWPLRHAWNQYF